MKSVRVLVVDESAAARAALAQVIQAEGDIHVVEEAADGETAVRLVGERHPDVVVLDLDGTRGGGLTTVEQIMGTHPTPILVLTGGSVTADNPLAFEAIRRGALDAAPRPSVADGAAARAFRAQVRMVSKVPVVRHVAASRARIHTPACPSPAAVAKPGTIPPTGTAPFCPVVGLAASAGGPPAVATVLGGFAADFSGCICLVQHLSHGFLMPMVRYLRSCTPLRVEVVEGSRPPQPGHVLVAAEDHHLVVQSSGLVGLSNAPPVDGHRPAATELFRSLASVLGGTAVGVVLTGIGRDGADGLLEMHKRGAFTIAQSKDSCAVWGMPRAATELGAICAEVDLKDIAKAIQNAVARRGVG